MCIVNVNKSVYEQMLISAVRYALGRATYIVGTTTDEVKRVWGELSENTRMVIRRDVCEALDRGQVGMEMDDSRWRHLIAFIDDYNVKESSK